MRTHRVFHIIRLPVPPREPPPRVRPRPGRGLPARRPLGLIGPVVAGRDPRRRPGALRGAEVGVSTPREGGRSMPAEWSAHRATLMAWPPRARAGLWGALFEAD